MPVSKEKRYDILCVGLANMSISLRPVGPEVFGVDLTLIDPIEVRSGGDALNEALTAARMGNRVGLVTKIGDDLFGRLLLEEARNAGVHTDHVIVSNRDRTAAAGLLVRENGDRTICAHRGALESFCLDEMDISVFDASKIVSIGSLFALKKLDGDGMRAILERARNAGAVTSADTKFDAYKIGFDGIRNACPFIDFFLPSYEEALYLTSEREPSRQCDALLGAGCGNVLIKLGEQGCFLAARGVRRQISACPARCVDTTGAGDNFVAGFLTGLNRDMPPEEAARLGCATAAVSIQEVGSNGGVRSYDQVVEHMRAVGYA
ncbi:MAG: carbohydrate kinase family protein [Spirochaetia bacterium]|jgi:sugar/nucleoside kinase (ribokinase family)